MWTRINNRHIDNTIYNLIANKISNNEELLRIIKDEWRISRAPKG